jgi:hypothetical protein
MKPREGQLHLGFDSADPGDSKPGGIVGDSSEQGRLPNARFASDNHDRTAAVARIVQELLERLKLAEPVA